jgi:hypothetical protein
VPFGRGNRPARLPQELRDQVGLLLDRLDSVSKLLQAGDSGSSSLLAKRGKSVRRKSAASPPSQTSSVRVDETGELSSHGTPEAGVFHPPSVGVLGATKVELAWARARIAELESALNNSRSVREPAAPHPGSASPADLRFPSGSLAVEQHGAAVVEGLLQHRGILRELLRAELRDIAKGRKRESTTVGSGDWSCQPLGDKSVAVSCHSVTHSVDRRSALQEANGEAASEMGSVPPSLVVPHPPSLVVPHPPSQSPEAEEDQQELQPREADMEQFPTEADIGPFTTYWSGDGSVYDASSQGELQSSQRNRRFISGRGPGALSREGSAKVDGGSPDPEARDGLESPKHFTSELESPRGRGGAPTRPSAGEAYMAAVLERAADGPNDLVRIVPRRNGARARRPSH